MLHAIAEALGARLAGEIEEETEAAAEQHRTDCERAHEWTAAQIEQRRRVAAVQKQARSRPI